MAALRFAGRVVLITGAGGGLGREYALEFARRGALVVVNDLGGSRHGDGVDQRAADHVVKEIQALGGKAVANYDSVDEGEKVVKTALDSYGRLDVVVNNAGIIRDRSFGKMTEQDWDLVHKVHLKGSFLVTKAAWPHLKKQQFGRVIMTASAAGLYGNFGQANYGAAKLGLLGLSKTLAVEGGGSNVLCNTIVPIASSRLTEGLIPQDLMDSLQPKYVVPLVVYLCHEDSQENGGAFELGAGWFGKLRWERCDGAYINHRPNEAVTAEQVRDNWAQITDFSHSHAPSGVQDAMSQMMQFAMTESTVVDDDRVAESAQTTTGMDVEAAKRSRPPPVQFIYTPRDVILYALGVGVSMQQEGSLRFLYENSGDFCVLPTFCVMPALTAILGQLSDFNGLSVDLTKVVHGEHYLEVFKPLSTSGKLTSTTEIKDILDTGTSAVIIFNTTTTDETGEKVAFNQATVVVVGSGKFGGASSSPHTYPLASIPSRPADATIVEATSVDQSAVYRLSGDYNPLHIDPQFAALGGYSRPLLHGLCCFGYATRAVLKQFCNDDLSLIKSVKLRFSRPVYPGQTLQTDMWQDQQRILFTTKVVETGEVCLSGGCVELTSVVTQQLEQTKTPGLASDSVFDDFRQRIAADPGLMKKVNAVYLWNVTRDGQAAAQWTTDLKQGVVQQGEHGKPDCSLTIGDDDLVAMAKGKLNPQKAFMAGKLKLSGNIMLAQKLSQLFNTQAKL